MSYDYKTQKPYIYTPDGVKEVMRMKDRADYLIKQSGCVRMDMLMHTFSGDSWNILALADYLVEIGQLWEIQQVHKPAAQHRIFVKP